MTGTLDTDAHHALETGRIGELLRRRDLLSDADLSKGLAVQQEIGGLLGQALHRIGAITEEALLDTLSEQLALPVLGQAHAPTDRQPIAGAAQTLNLPISWLIARRAIPWLIEPTVSGVTRIGVAAADPLDAGLREKIDAATRVGSENKLQVVYFLADNQVLDAMIALCDSHADEDVGDDELSNEARLRELAEEAPVIDYVNNMFFGALKQNASDIHIEAYEYHAAVRYRIDGVLLEHAQFSRSRFDAIASRIKLIAGMDIAERRLPQDGRCTVRFAGKDVDLRVSSVPSTWGESIVIRLLRKQTELPDLSGLGLTGRTRTVLEKIINMPNGVFLVTGPTGSGKSTTLYRGLELINNGERKIITIEDPVEYDISGVTQIQVKPEIGYDFAKGLRAILRQDPDVIMVGEIRDGETATIAAQAALTGHMVLSTLHTNSALDAVMRLRDIGLETFLIAASVRGLMAQRLVRRICSECSAPEDPKVVFAALDELEHVDPSIAFSGDANWRKAVGCEACAHTGYSGRIAISEIVAIDEDMREAITNGVTASQLQEIAQKQGFETLFEDGVRKAHAGVTTVAEALRVSAQA